MHAAEDKDKVPPGYLSADPVIHVTIFYIALEPSLGTIDMLLSSVLLSYFSIV